jgi:CRISPR/Cas system type I-B associated protein Csh2 (Cas7 group RAMP superfamily)
MTTSISHTEANELAEHLLAELSNELTCLSVDDYRMVMTMLWRELGDNKKLATWIREFYGEDAEYENELARKELAQNLESARRA